MFNEEHPLVSVITPSFNQARYIRETIESVLTQDYPNIELIVVDGGSTDGTLDILQSYAHWGDRFRYVSEPDRGQSHAINKGFGMAKGPIIGWLNSDDTYMPGAVRKAVDLLKANRQFAFVYGRANYIDEFSRVIRPYGVEPFNPKRLFETCIICQPAVFMQKDMLAHVGGVDENLSFCMDYDLWIRLSRLYPVGFLDDCLANSRLHDACKSVSSWADLGLPEIIRTSMKHYGAVSDIWLKEYIRVNRHNGPYWVLSQFKTYSVFGRTPTVSQMNRYHDLWAPPRFTMVVEASSDNPLRKILINGTHMIPYLSRKRSGRLRIAVYINGRRIRKSFSLAKGSFTLEIPVLSNRPRYVIELVASTKIIPARQKMSSDRRALSYLIHDIIPCSAREYETYKLLA